MKYVFPFAVIGLSFAASVPYALQGDWRRSVFWFCAGILNLMMTL